MALVDPASLVFTREDYYGMPETASRYQLIGGGLHMAPAPNRRHQTVSRNLELAVFHYLKANPIGQAWNAPFDVELDRWNIFQPDLLYVSNERSGILTCQGVSGAPDLIVEILSDRTRELDLGAKLRVYLSSGVRELWIVDPEAETVAVYRDAGEGLRPLAELSGGEAVIETPLLPGFSLALAEVFPGEE